MQANAIIDLIKSLVLNLSICGWNDLLALILAHLASEGGHNTHIGSWSISWSFSYVSTPCNEKPNTKILTNWQDGTLFIDSITFFISENNHFGNHLDCCRMLPLMQYESLVFLFRYYVTTLSECERIRKIEQKEIGSWHSCTLSMHNFLLWGNQVKWDLKQSCRHHLQQEFW